MEYYSSDIRADAAVPEDASVAAAAAAGNASDDSDDDAAVRDGDSGTGRSRSFFPTL